MATQKNCLNDTFEQPKHKFGLMGKYFMLKIFMTLIISEGNLRPKVQYNSSGQFVVVFFFWWWWGGGI